MSDDDLPWKAAQKHSAGNRAEVESSTLCGCFYCYAVFVPGDIADWADTNDPLPEQTAICPHCGVDSVIGDKSGFAITQDFLKAIHKAWF